MPTPDELADALLKEWAAYLDPEFIEVEGPRVHTLAREAAKQALLDAAMAIEEQRDKTNSDRSAEEGASVLDHRDGRFLGKTVASRLVRARAIEVGTEKS